MKVSKHQLTVIGKSKEGINIINRTTTERRGTERRLVLVLYDVAPTYLQFNTSEGATACDVSFLIGHKDIDPLQILICQEQYIRKRRRNF